MEQSKGCWSSGGFADCAACGVELIEHDFDVSEGAVITCQDCGAQLRYTDTDLDDTDRLSRYWAMVGASK